MRRIKLVLGMLALLSVLLAMSAAPAIADDDEEDVDVDVEGPFLVDDEVCVFVVTEEEDHDGDEDVDVEEECVEPQFTALKRTYDYDFQPQFTALSRYDYIYDVVDPIIQPYEFPRT